MTQIFLSKIIIHLRYDSSPTLPSLYLRHSSSSNLSVASPTSQFILQPLFRFSYVTSSSPGEPPMDRARYVSCLTWICVPCTNISSLVIRHSALDDVHKGSEFNGGAHGAPLVSPPQSTNMIISGETSRTRLLTALTLTDSYVTTRRYQMYLLTEIHTYTTSLNLYNIQFLADVIVKKNI